MLKVDTMPNDGPSGGSADGPSNALVLRRPRHQVGRALNRTLGPPGGLKLWRFDRGGGVCTCDPRDPVAVRKSWSGCREQERARNDDA